MAGGSGQWQGVDSAMKVLVGIRMLGVVHDVSSTTERVTPLTQ